MWQQGSHHNEYQCITIMLSSASKHSFNRYSALSHWGPSQMSPQLSGDLASGLLLFQNTKDHKIHQPTRLYVGGHTVLKAKGRLTHVDMNTQNAGAEVKTQLPEFKTKTMKQKLSHSSVLFSPLWLKNLCWHPHKPFTAFDANDTVRSMSNEMDFYIPSIYTRQPRPPTASI